MKPGDEVEVTGDVPNGLRRFIGERGRVTAVVGRWVMVEFIVTESRILDTKELTIVRLAHAADKPVRA